MAHFNLLSVNILEQSRLCELSYVFFFYLTFSFVYSSIMTPKCFVC